MLYVFLIFLNLLLLSYEFIIFNEEFFIAVTFFSFFFAASSVISSFLTASYIEDKTRVFQYVADDVFINYFFFQNYINYFTVYEYNKEFLYHYVNFLTECLYLKFIHFYENMLSNKALDINIRVPEIFFNFSDKLLSFVSSKVQTKFLEYFNNKWDTLILGEVVIKLFLLESNNDHEEHLSRALGLAS
jgi:hypothetical protein